MTDSFGHNKGCFVAVRGLYQFFAISLGFSHAFTNS